MPEFAEQNPIFCNKCGTQLTRENARPSCFKLGWGYCRSCRSEVEKAKYKKHRSSVLKRCAKYRKEHHQEIMDKRREIKLKVFIHYSGTDPPQCANPYGEHKEPYTTLAALQIDHINGGGFKQMKTLGTNGSHMGDMFYRWLIKEGYPEGYQVLCANCNWIKRFKDHENSNSTKVM